MCTAKASTHLELLRTLPKYLNFSKLFTNVNSLKSSPELCKVDIIQPLLETGAQGDKDTVNKC